MTQCGRGSRHRVLPQDGAFIAPDRPGLGLELDPDQIEAERELG